MAENIGFPCFVKPVNMGSKCWDQQGKGTEQLVEAVELACKYDGEIIVEEYINCGR